MSKNKHGLNRTISPEIKREIRQRSKFGCVVCRCGIYEYEHIAPEFHDAHRHDPEKMCLLCGSCHSKVTRKILSKETVTRCYQEVQKNEDAKSPVERFDLNSQNIIVKVGTCTFKYAKEIIKFGDKIILAINPPEDEYSFPSISGIFTDKNGKEIFSIKNNEWKGPTEYWDVEFKGNELTIRSAARQIALKLKVNPPNEIEIITLDIKIDNCHLSCKNGSFSLGRITESSEYYLGIEYLESYGSTTGILIKPEQFKAPKLTNLKIVGGEGIELVGTGIIVAKGSGKVVMRGLTIEEATKEKTIRSYMPLIENFSILTEELPPRL